MSRVNWLSTFAGFAVGLVAATFVWVQVLPPEATQPSDAGELLLLPEGAVPEDVSGDSGPRVTVRHGPGGAATEGGGGGVDVSGGGAGGSAGGGAAEGVTASVIKLGATVAEDGIARSFLGEVRFGMEAVRTRVNRAGGVAGRQLEIIYKDDAWDADRGAEFIRRLIEEDNVFALAVSPSSEGLNKASDAGMFETHGLPVVGADGLNNSQFILRTGSVNPWIWPVAAATTTQVHIILKDAFERCKASAACTDLRPAIVFGNTYRFGVEGSFAFNGAFCRVNGGEVKADGRCSTAKGEIPGFKPGGTSCEVGSRFCGISATQGEFSQEIGRVNDACKLNDPQQRCNFIMLLVEPDTALKWMRGFGKPETFERDGSCCGIAGAQPLFTANFATECANQCDRMRVWTGYNPPCCSSGNQAVADFARELEAQNSRADTNNQFTLGGYLGMTLLVEALNQVGPDLTRERLVSTLNSMPTLKTGLSNPDGLKWSASSKYANHSAQSFRIDFSDRFGGWKDRISYIKDPWLGYDNLLP